MTAAEVSVWATVAATAVTAVATGVLAWFTWTMARATGRMADATNAPSVVATFEPNRWSFIHTDLVIENTGNAPAYDVRIEFDPPLKSDRDDEPVDEPPLNRITALRPSTPLRHWVGRGYGMLESDYRVTVSWLSNPNSQKRDVLSYQLNLRHYKGLHQLGSGDPQVKIADELKKIREGLERRSRN